MAITRFNQSLALATVGALLSTTGQAADSATEARLRMLEAEIARLRPLEAEVAKLRHETRGAKAQAKIATNVANAAVVAQGPAGSAAAAAGLRQL